MTGKRIWMPLYVADYLADTAHLSAAEHGAYLLLIMHYWTKGKLPEDEETLRRISHLNARQWLHSRNTIRSLFRDHWRHKRVDQELAKALEKSSVNSANAKRSHLNRKLVAELSQPVRSPQSRPEPEKKDGANRERKHGESLSHYANRLADDIEPIERSAGIGRARGPVRGGSDSW